MSRYRIEALHLNPPTPPVVEVVDCFEDSEENANKVFQNYVSTDKVQYSLIKDVIVTPEMLTAYIRGNC